VYSLYQRNASGQPVVDASGNNVYNYVNPIANDFNPVGLAEKDTYLTKTARALVNTYVEVSFLKDFKARSSFSADYINNRESLFYNTEHGNGANVKGRAARYTVQTMTLQITNTLNWSHRFGLHNVSALIGQEAYKDHYDNISTAKTGFPFAGVEELIAGSTPVTASSYYTDSRLSSLFSRVNYDYKKRWFKCIWC
jgi:hypothetical protein